MLCVWVQHLLALQQVVNLNRTFTISVKAWKAHLWDAPLVQHLEHFKINLEKEVTKRAQVRESKHNIVA